MEELHIKAVSVVPREDIACLVSADIISILLQVIPGMLALPAMKWDIISAALILTLASGNLI